MKLIITGLFLIITKVGLGQNHTYTQKDSLSILKPLVVSNKSLNFNSLVSHEKTFTSFNRNQSFYTVYEQKNDTVFIGKQVIYNPTAFLSNRDSFNPSGANSLGTGIAFGLFNLLFEKK